MAVAVTPPRAAAVVPRRGHFLRAMPPKAKVGAAILCVFLLIAILGPAIAPYDPSATNALATGPTAPTLHHLLGTTSTGQDVLSQLLVGMRSSVVLGLLTATIATVLAVATGLTAGFLGGVADEGLSLLMNVFVVLPALPLLIVLLGYLPHSGDLPTAIVLSALGWSWGARVIRAQTLTLRGRDFIGAARETGERTWRLVVFEILPNEVSLIAANFVGTFLYAILTSVALAFIGVANFSTWNLGTMLYWAQNGDAFNIGAWWWYVPPGLSAALLGMSLVLLNSGLDELGNPRLRSAPGRRKRSWRPARGWAHPARSWSGHAWRPTDPTPVERTEIT
jgi:peptide/nickel transport system permease protein